MSTEKQLWRAQVSALTMRVHDVARREPARYDALHESWPTLTSQLDALFKALDSFPSDDPGLFR